MKAWRVEPSDDPWYDGWFSWTDGEQPIVHAEDRAHALAKSPYFREYGRRGLRVSRAPEFDDKPLIPRTYLENGFSWACSCGVEMTIDGPVGWEDHQRAAPGVVYDKGGMPYCSQRCLDAARRERVESGS